MNLRNSRCTLFPLILIFIITAACSSTQNRKAEITITHEFQLSDSTQKYLTRMYPSVADNPKAEELAFSNYLSPIKIVITDHNGALVETIGQEGRGPEEIISARNFGYDTSQNVVILDKAGGLFKRYNRKTGEVESHLYPIKEGISVTSRNLQMCKDKWYLGVQMLEEMSPLTNVPIIAVFDNEFNVVDTLGGYDPFFEGRKDVLQDPMIKIDCENRRIYTTHGKVPFIQIFSMDNENRIGRITNIPPSFMLSDKFVTMVTNRRERIRFLSEEQSLSLRIAHTKKYIYHIFANERKINNRPTQNRNFIDRDFFAAVYDKESLEYLGEAKLPGPAIGSTKEGNLIILKDELTSEFQFVKLAPIF